MGMFDYVNIIVPCPVCGCHITGFQTKDTDCGLEKVDYSETAKFYSTCGNCNEWVEFRKKVKTKKMSGEAPVMTIEELESEGYKYIKSDI